LLTGAVDAAAMRIEVMLIARENGATTTVSTAIDLDTRDPRWAGALVGTVAEQAEEGARRLRDQVLDRDFVGASDRPRPAPEFIPLATLAPSTSREGRPDAQRRPA
jgi:hypothetical protein